LASRLLGGRFFLPKSHAEVQTGRISGMISQAEFSPLFELSSYTHLGSSVASVSHLSLKFDLRHTRFIFTRQNITVASSHMSESHAHHIFPGVMSHISIRSSFSPPENVVILFLVSQNITPVNIPREISHIAQ
jgi:hypothetical protein